MPRENYWRISYGYEPKEPTNTFSFYQKCFAASQKESVGQEYQEMDFRKAKG